ncbi:MAG TPA: UDP-N-acetylmuramoyl-tripeptide--D-alanyl-D-alanine ligase [Limnochordales bacterium]
MERLTAGAVAEACGATVQAGSAETVVERVCTDSRQVQPGDLFVALRGPRFDGHEFVADALARGARAVMVERGRAGEVNTQAGAVLVVDDSLAALQRLAAWYRRRLRDAAVVAVTGSVGKTTTKEMVAAALSGLGAVVKAPASFNNEVGVPLVILAADPGTRALVLEIGMRGPGQIRHLAGVAAPTVGIVTNVGESHVGMLGSVEAIARAKAELVESLQPGAVAVLNGDDERVRAMARLAPDGVRVLTFGRGADCDVRLLAVEGGGLGGTRLELGYGGQRVACRLAVPGRHMAINAAAAVAAALACGVELEAAARGLDGFSGAAMRMEVIRTADDIVLLNDAYNASPTSMRAALETLARVAAEERRRAVAILGDMLELGALAEQAHRGIGREAAERGVELLVAVGEMAAEMASGAREAGAGAEMAIVTARDAEHAAAVACRQVQPGDAVLVKASRAMGLDRVVRELVQAHAPAGSNGGGVREEAELT